MAAQSNPNVLPLHGDRAKERSLGAVGQAHLPAIRVIELYQGLDRVEKVDFNDLFHKDAVLSDPISNVKGAENLKKRFLIFNSLIVPDVAAGQAPSEATVRLSVQKEGELCLKIVMDKKVKFKVSPSVTGPMGVGTGTVSTEEWMADKDGYDHFVFSTVITVTLDPVEHKIVRLEDEWAGIDAALAKGGPGARSDMPKWFVTMQRERRDLTMEAAHKDW